MFEELLRLLLENDLVIQKSVSETSKSGHFGHTSEINPTGIVLRNHTFVGY
jgi:hypothetical protein